MLNNYFENRISFFPINLELFNHLIILVLNQQELEDLKEIYILNYKWGVFYKQCVLTANKPFIKEIYKKLICQKKNFINLLQSQMLKKVDKDYLQKLHLECREELKVLQQKFPPELNNKHSLLCCHVEKKLHQKYCDSLGNIKDGKIRALLLSQKHQLNLILKETEKIEKYLI